ncbi:N utilization substance protein B [Clostridium aceticum]|uniref:Transcription antitermination protein NusB n=1 Tax=Clostridium aceticum TaxID=84022 RepID=A0A0D8IDG9_9CLOT|nr:transcription antitermination factor NusB [Clostridium aceticum]AKL95299.1 N utilization substance protein B [Clostridium aceticum]KJF28144.1 antitermination protein NusB [Clostridium aceticum]
MNRKLARELCMKAIFEMLMNKEYDEKLIKNYLSEEEEIEELQAAYIRGVITVTVDHLEEINSMIEKYAIGWTLDRIAKVDLAILQLALAEILYIEDIPYNVSINEAVELAKKYSGSESTSFINGILGKLVEKEGIKKND